ncbi:MAG: molybdopterin-guanine dinucleotide biosynthesis protein B [Candidatus Schekmanbacteria bacterium]|nr:molybdopterin-guanine dinucleotide biosynthesis protein B [Candidatus Schekmanbacteria bacterium]
MKLVHIVGRKNHGKTTLLVELLRELRGRGLRVGTIKHSPHKHELDAPGKDSFVHRHAGAAPAAIVAADLSAVFVPRTPGDDPIASLLPLYSECDAILVEGYVMGPGHKIEVWRRERGTPPLAAEHEGILAVVTDDAISLPVPTWPRSDVGAVADGLLQILGNRRDADPGGK